MDPVPQQKGPSPDMGQALRLFQGRTRPGGRNPLASPSQGPGGGDGAWDTLRGRRLRFLYLHPDPLL